MTPFDLRGLKTYDLLSRPSKVFIDDLGRPLAAHAGIGDWIDSLPKQLAAAGASVGAIEVAGDAGAFAPLIAAGHRIEVQLADLSSKADTDRAIGAFGQ